MTVTYGVTRETYFLGTAERTSYGIAAYSEAEADGAATVIARVCDVAPDRESVAGLVELCNRLELSPIHLRDVVEDFIG